MQVNLDRPLEISKIQSNITTNAPPVIEAQPKPENWTGNRAENEIDTRNLETIQSKTVHLQTDALIEAEPATPEEMEMVRKGLTSFSQRLALKLCEKQKSICFSPMSIIPVLGMILKGLPYGKPKQDMLEALGCEGMKESRFHAALGEILKQTSSKTKNGQSEINIANGLAVADQVSEFYIGTIRNIYQGEVFVVSGNAADQINGWFSDNTKQRITQMITPEEAMQLSLAILNAISFDGDWENSFSESNTIDSLFTCLNGKKVEAKIMYQKNNFSLYEDPKDEFKILKMPYKDLDGKALYQLIFLPKDPNTLLERLKDMTPEKMNSLCETAYQRQVNVHFPKLEVNYEEEQLLEFLMKMGCPLHIKLKNVSDFCNSVSLIRHKVKLKSDEKGTVAAAATMGFISKSLSTHYIPTFNATSPFAIYIMSENDVVFQGTVIDETFLVKKQID